VQRRDVLRLAVLALPISACGAPSGPAFTCDDTSRLTPAERAMRTSQEYTDQSTQPDHRCSNCRYFTPAPPGACGACQVMRGPIHPDGFCNLWTARA
jgi:hypothetical protein